MKKVGANGVKHVKKRGRGVDPDACCLKCSKLEHFKMSTFKIGLSRYGMRVESKMPGTPNFVWYFDFLLPNFFANKIKNDFSEGEAIGGTCCNTEVDDVFNDVLKDQKLEN